MDKWVRSRGWRTDRPLFQVMMFALMFVILVLGAEGGYGEGKRVLR